MKLSYDPSLDGLRAVAVIIVLLAHADAPFPQSGGVGVDIFFVLSGFLITGILHKEIQQTGRICIRNFYIRRFLRLMPALLVATLSFAIFQYYYLDHFPTVDVLIALSYTANWARAIFQWDLGAYEHFWSLAIEEQYYLVWPLMIVALSRAKMNDLQRFKILMIFAFALTLYRILVVGEYSAERIYFALDTHMDGLVIGSALYFLLQAREEKLVTLEITPIASYCGVPIFVGLLLLMMYIITWKSPLMAYFGYTYAAIVAALVIADLRVSSHSMLRRVLSGRVLVQIGKISYGVYLYHLPIYILVEEFVVNRDPIELAAIKIILSLCAAGISYYFMERYFLKLKSRFYGGPKKVDDSQLEKAA